MRRDHNNFETVNRLKLECFRVSGTGHAGQVVVEAEIVLESYRRDRLVLLLDRDTFFRFYRLVQAVTPATARHRAPGKLIDNNDFAVVNDVIDIALIHRMRAQCRIQVMQQLDIAGVIQALAFCK